jgi:hypothetical protein
MSIDQFTAELHRRTDYALTAANYFPVTMLGADQGLVRNFELGCASVRDNPRTGLMLMRMSAENASDRVRASLPRAGAEVNYRTLALYRIIEGRFEAIRTNIFQRHATINDVYDACNGRRATQQTIRRELAVWVDKRYVEMADHRGDRRRTLIVPTKTTIREFIVNKTAMWVHRIAIAEQQYTAINSLKTWLVSEIGLDPGLIEWAAEESRRLFPIEQPDGFPTMIVANEKVIKSISNN